MRQQILNGSEEQEQEFLFEWAAYRQATYPELKLMFHVPNGGKRDRGTAIKLKRQGVKPGVPDIMLPVPKLKHGYAGLFIEMKTGKNKPTEYQMVYLTELRKQGYYIAVCYGWKEAVRIIETYLNEDKNKLELYALETEQILKKSAKRG